MTYPPGPRDWLFGARLVSRIKREPLSFFAELQHRYGDSVYMKLGPYRDYTFFHPEQIKEVLVTKARHFTRMPWQRTVLAQWDGNGLVISEGDFWLRQRRLVKPAFDHKRLAAYGRQMVEETERLAARWAAPSPPTPLPQREEGSESPSSPVLLPRRREGSIVRMDEAMTDLTLAIITKVFFGVDATGQAREIAEAVGYLSDLAVREFETLITPPRWLPLASVKRKWAAIRTLDEFIRGIIKQRRAEGNTDRGDLLSMLLRAVDEEGDGGQMTDEQARDEAMVLFLAGHDTTAAGLIWAWYVLAKHPEIQAKVQAELDRELAGREVTVADLPRLAYLERVIKESLRLYPPAVGVFTRYVAEPVEIGGYPLRRRSLIHILSYVTQRDARWFPEPERFDPDRWLPERCAGLPQFAYFPFGGGPRVCIGRELATTEMMLILATLLRRFEVALPPEQGKVEMLVHMSLRPKGGLRVQLKARSGQ